MYAWMVRRHAQAKREYDLFQGAFRESKGIPYPEFLQAETPCLKALRELYNRDHPGAIAEETK
jgi:hypothetical protein